MSTESNTGAGNAYPSPQELKDYNSSGLSLIGTGSVYERKRRVKAYSPIVPVLAVALSGSSMFAQYNFTEAQSASATYKVRQELPGARLTAQQRRALARYGPAISVAFGEQEVPSSIMGQLSTRVHPSDPVAEAQSALETHGAAFRCGPDDGFTPEGVDTDKTGVQHVRMRQTYKGIPVIGGELIVHLDQTFVTGISGRFVPDLDLSAELNSSPETAATAFSSGGNDTATVAQMARAGERVIAVDEIGIAHVAVALEPKTDTSSGSNHEKLFIDAKTGQLLGNQVVAPMTNPGGCSPDQLVCPTSSNLLRNSGFESGNDGNWAVYSSTGNTTDIIGQFGSSCFTGTWCTLLNGWGSTNTERIYQSVKIPSNTSSASLSFYLRINTSEGSQYPYDKLKVQLWSAKPVTIGSLPGVVLATLKTYSNVDAWSLPFSNGNYVRQAFDVTSFRGQTIFVYFEGQEDSSLQTSFWIDSVALNAVVP